MGFAANVTLPKSTTSTDPNGPDVSRYIDLPGYYRACVSESAGVIQSALVIRPSDCHVLQVNAPVPYNVSIVRNMTDVPNYIGAVDCDTFQMNWNGASILNIPPRGHGLLGPTDYGVATSLGGYCDNSTSTSSAPAAGSATMTSNPVSSATKSGAAAHAVSVPGLLAASSLLLWIASVAA